MTTPSDDRHDSKPKFAADCASPVAEAALPLRRTWTRPATPTPAKPSANELLKLGSPTLSGTIARTLADAQADRFSEDDNQFLKFQGIYKQDDRDLRKTGKKFILMVRLRLAADSSGFVEGTGSHFFNR